MTTAWDVEFSLALHNRTGKFHIGRQVLSDQRDLVRRVLYWRRPAPHVPTGPRAKVLGRLLAMELSARRSRLLDRAAPRLRPRRPVLHLDPFTVAFHRLGEEDMVLCHDLGPVTHPDLFAPSVGALYRTAYSEIARAAPRMAFVSEASRAAFASLYGGVGDMRVIYPPIRSDIRGPGEVEPGSGQRPYLLTVGSVGHRKNQAGAIRAFGRAGLARDGFELVICGGREPGFAEVAEAAARSPGVRLLDYMSDADLAALYARASGFVLVSRLEGFGMPVAEAIGHGLVPLVSAGSVLEEVAGPGALAVDPRNEPAVAEAMIALASMPAEERNRRRRLLAAAIERFTPQAFFDGWRSALTT